MNRNAEVKVSLNAIVPELIDVQRTDANVSKLKSSATADVILPWRVIIKFD